MKGLAGWLWLGVSHNVHSAGAGGGARPERLESGCKPLSRSSQALSFSRWPLSVDCSASSQRGGPGLLHKASNEQSESHLLWSSLRCNKASLLLHALWYKQVIKLRSYKGRKITLRKMLWHISFLLNILCYTSMGPNSIHVAKPRISIWSHITSQLSSFWYGGQIPPFGAFAPWLSWHCTSPLSLPTSSFFVNLPSFPGLYMLEFLIWTQSFFFPHPKTSSLAFNFL